MIRVIPEGSIWQLQKDYRFVSTTMFGNMSIVIPEGTTLTVVDSVRSGGSYSVMCTSGNVRIYMTEELLLFYARELSPLELLALESA